MSSFGQSTRTSKSVKFHTKGSHIVGILLAPPVEVQVTDMNTGKPSFWDEEGKRPRMQWIFSLLKTSETVCECDEWCDGGEKNSEYGSEDDDGLRKLYVSSNSMTRAIAKAIRDAGVKSGDPEVGSTLVVKFTSYDKDAQKPGRKPPKVFTAGYKRPTPETLAKVAEVNGAPDDDEGHDDVEADLWAVVSGGTSKSDSSPEITPISTGGKLSFEDMANFSS